MRKIILTERFRMCQWRKILFGLSIIVGNVQNIFGRILVTRTRERERETKQVSSSISEQQMYLSLTQELALDSRLCICSRWIRWFLLPLLGMRQLLEVCLCGIWNEPSLSSIGSNPHWTIEKASRAAHLHDEEKTYGSIEFGVLYK